MKVFICNEKCVRPWSSSSCSICLFLLSTKMLKMFGMNCHVLFVYSALPIDINEHFFLFLFVRSKLLRNVLHSCTFGARTPYFPSIITL